MQTLLKAKVINLGNNKKSSPILNFIQFESIVLLKDDDIVWSAWKHAELGRPLWGLTYFKKIAEVQ